MKDLMKYGSKIWLTLSEKEKDPYKILADIDQIRYQRDRLNLQG
jgi:hypothetical protein